MGKLYEIGQKISKRGICYFLIGLVFLLLYFVLIFKQGSNVRILLHDQFDIEIFASLLPVWYPDGDIYPSFMGGMPKSALYAHAYGLQYFFKFFDPLKAYIYSYFFILLIGYSGMFKLLEYLKIRYWLVLICSMLWCFQPCYSLFGLTVLGIPLLVYLILNGAGQKYDTLILILYCTIYGLFSSLVLCGYVIIVILSIVLFRNIYIKYYVKKEKFTSQDYAVFTVLITLLFVYSYTNFELIKSAIGIGGFLTHRTEWVIGTNEPTLRKFVNFILYEQYHACCNQAHIVLFCVFVSIIQNYNFNLNKRIIFYRKMIVYLFCFSIGITLFYGFFHSGFITNIRNTLPIALRCFQFDRIYFLFPILWYVLLAVAGELLLLTYKCNIKKLIGCILVICCFIGTILQDFENNNFLYSLNQQYCNSNNNIVSARFPKWKEFFSEDIFTKIKNDINENQANYKVVSIGMHPSVALYNGFYTLDGYSSNYPLAYKKKFYNVIKNELMLDYGIRNYYLGWGSRCYVFTHELKQNCMVYKNSKFVLKDLRIDLRALKSMKCKYIFSAVEIKNHSKYGLTKIGDYSSVNSFYRVRVYKL